ncbi:1-acyl-sn-glycerol-3-phosphate acyltransferase [Geothrix oryzisoli]|uniref:1-acyl-sn-glycerol-3-phosphate acyltransferase n=1 Tax=Geothrix oryzisoli TaxID=2922721 RepID=UPI001FAD0952|nr:1-acyl-sn-glycerol-3-phosphate acyltransferase [Geothrix oryzisoli]
MHQSTPYPAPPEALRQPRGWLWRALGRAYLRLGGWRIEGAFPEELKFVTIVAPHTSNWDFVVGVAVVFALELRVSWLGKHSLFQTPLKRFFLWLGGIPVNRQVRHGVVDTCVKAFEGVPARLLALAPEGTRKGVSQWRSGFYAISTTAKVPLFPVGFDFRDHVIRLMPVFRPDGNLDLDLPRIQALFKDIHGLRERPRGAATSA